MLKAQFQSFESSNEGRHSKARVAELRQVLAKAGLAGFLVPRANEHQGEYVPASEARLAWLTGFTGSAGLAIVLADKAALFADGRYVTQAKAQTDTKVFAIVPSHQIGPEAWLEKHLKRGAKLGYDARLHTAGSVTALAKSVAKAGAKLVAVKANPIDRIWRDRPKPPANPIYAHAKEFTGETTAKKIARLRERMAQAKLDRVLVSDPHDTAWLFNLRGSDIPHTPIALLYAYVPLKGKPWLFVDPSRFEEKTKIALRTVATLRPPASLPEAISKGAKGLSIGCDAGTCAAAWVDLIRKHGGEPVIAASLIARMKAVKNEVELLGHRAAQRRDGLAVTRFLNWLDEEAPKGTITEIDAAIALEGFRRASNLLVDLSFPTISGAGPNAALPHYRVSEATNRRISEGIYLFDSGGQYRDGTTDITRTVAIGTPTRKMKDRFTRVLKGMIAVSTAIFPKGTTGAQIDAFARRALWEAGEDYDHGTGHGIGSFLSVHEGPQSISLRGVTALEPGMILSNEPGYYEEGAFGIRIENLLLVETRKIAGGAREMLGFETLTLAPIDTRLIDMALMRPDEIAWLNAYHARVRATLAPGLSGKDLAFLQRATAKIGA